MARTWLVGCALAASIAMLPGIARADMPTKGSLFVGADRMTGIYAVSYKHVEPVGPQDAPVTVTDSGTMFNLLWNNSTTSSGVVNLQAIPRLSVDYAITDIVTLGGSVGYFSASGTRSVPAEPQADLPTASGFAFAPRVGFFFGISDLFGVWPRVGVTYGSYKVEDNSIHNARGILSTWTDRDSWSNFSVDAEVQFLLAPLPHFGFTFGPLLSLPLSGSHSHEHIEPGVDQSTTFDAKLQNIGFTVGLVGWF